MITKLFRRFNLSEEETVENEKLEAGIVKLKEYCLNKGFIFYPKLLRSPLFRRADRFIKKRAERDLSSDQFDRKFMGDFSEIYEGVRYKQLSLRDVKKYLEVGGLIAVGNFGFGRLKEYCYSPPSIENINSKDSRGNFTALVYPLENIGFDNHLDSQRLLKLNPDALNSEFFRNLSSSISVDYRDAFLSSNPSDILIDWHTHPGNFGILSESDCDHFNRSIVNVNNYCNYPNHLYNRYYMVVFNPVKNKTYWYKPKLFSFNDYVKTR